MKQIYYWSPFTSKVATVLSVINSTQAINRYGKKSNLKATIIDSVGEWRPYYNELKKKNIDLEIFHKSHLFLKFDKLGFIKSRLAYWYIFFKSFFKLHFLLKKKKPDFLIIHLITSLPLTLYVLFNYKTKLILRISGLPKLNIFRKFIWKLASKILSNNMSHSRHFTNFKENRFFIK